MRSLRRALAGFAALATAALVLAGCMSVDSHIAIESDGTATVGATITIDKQQYADAFGISKEEAAERIRESMDGESENPGSSVEETPDSFIQTTTVEGTYDESGFHAPELESDLSQGQIDIVKDGPAATFRYGMTGADDALGDMDDPGKVRAAMKRIISDYSMVVTFPGAVTEADDYATVDGDTVSWDLDGVIDAYLAGDTLTATGSLDESYAQDGLAPGEAEKPSGQEATAPDAGKNETEPLKAAAAEFAFPAYLWIVLGVVALIIVAAIVTLVIVLVRKNRTAPAGVIPPPPGPGNGPPPPPAP